MPSKRKVGSLFIDIRLGTAALQKELDGLSRKMQSFGRKLETIGRGFTTAFTLPLAAAGAGATLAAVKIDNAQKKIRVATGATGKELEALNKNFDTVFRQVPQSAESVGQAIGDISTRTGLTGKSLEGLSKQILDLSRITDTDLSSTVASTTRVFGDWSIETKDMSSSLDFLFKVTQQTGVGLDRLGRLIVQYGEPLRQFGFGFQESAALIGKFEKEGVNLEIMFSGLRQAIGRFSDAGIPLQEGLRGIFKQLQSLSQVEAVNLSRKIFGAEAGADFAGAVRSGRFEIDDLLTSLNNSKETINGAAAASETFQDKLAKLGNKFALLLDKVGSPILDKLLPFFDQLGVVVDGLIDRFGRLSPEIQNNVLLFGALLAAIGPLALGLKAIIALGAIIISPLGLIAAAIAGLIVAIYKYRDEIFEVLDSVQNKINAFKGNFKLGLEVVKQRAIDLVNDPFASSEGTIDRTIARLKSAGKNLDDFYGKAQTHSSDFGKGVDAIHDWVEGVKEGTQQAVEQAKEFVNVDDKLKNMITSLNKAGGATKDLAGEWQSLTREFERTQYLDGLEKGIQKSIDSLDRDRFLQVSAEYKAATQEDFFREFKEKYGDAISDDQLWAQAGKEAGVEMERVTDEWARNLEQKQKEAYQNGIDFWRNTFQNAITGTTFDLEDSMKNIAVGFAAELANSLAGNFGGNIKSPQDLGGLLFKGIGDFFGLGAGGGQNIGPVADGGAYASSIASSGFIASVAPAIGAALAPLVVQSSISGIKNAFKGEKLSFQEEAALALPTFGASFAYDPLRSAFGFGGTRDKDTQARKQVQDILTEILKEATGGSGLKIFNPGGGAANLDVFNFTDTSNQFDSEAGFDFLRGLSGEAQSTFNGLAVAFKEIFDLPEGLANEQIAVLLGESLLGDIDNARLLVRELGLELGQVQEAIFNTARQGEISWLQYNTAIAGTEQAFGKGLAAAGDFTKAMDQLINSGGRGFGALDGLMNLAIEGIEAGATSIQDLGNKLIEAGYSSQDVAILMQAMAGRGIDSLEALANASEQTVGAIVGDADAAGFGFAAISEEVIKVKDAFKELQSIALDKKVLEVEVVATGDVGLLEGTQYGERLRTPANVGVEAFASGGVVNAPTSFSFGKGRMGVMGENYRPEGILPLGNVGGKLGVNATGLAGNQTNYYIDATGASAGVADDILAALQMVEDRAVQRSVGEVADYMQRNGI